MLSGIDPWISGTKSCRCSKNGSSIDREGGSSMSVVFLNATAAFLTGLLSDFYGGSLVPGAGAVLGSVGDLAETS